MGVCFSIICLFVCFGCSIVLFVGFCCTLSFHAQCSDVWVLDGFHLTLSLWSSPSMSVREHFHFEPIHSHRRPWMSLSVCERPRAPESIENLPNLIDFWLTSIDSTGGGGVRWQLADYVFSWRTRCQIHCFEAWSSRPSNRYVFFNTALLNSSLRDLELQASKSLRFL